MNKPPKSPEGGLKLVLEGGLSPLKMGWLKSEDCETFEVGNCFSEQFQFSNNFSV